MSAALDRLSELERAARLPDHVRSRINLDGPGGCWLWVGARCHGYGRVQLGGRNGPVRPAHRFVYETLVGSIPEGLQIDHLCRTKSCVNPAHLEPVTSAENTRRGIHRNSKKVTCPQGHPYSPENTHFRPNGGRLCLICRRLQMAARRMRVPRTDYVPAVPCPGHARHWFTVYGEPGNRSPVCVRCGAPNPAWREVPS